MRTLALLGLLWAGAWLVVPFAGGASAGAALLLLTLAMMIFAIGECLHGAVHAPLVVDLAEPRLIGRYMALSALSWQVGFALGPAVGGYALDLSPSGVWFGAATLCAVGASSRSRSRRRSPRASAAPLSLCQPKSGRQGGLSVRLAR